MRRRDFDRMKKDEMLALGCVALSNDALLSTVAKATGLGVDRARKALYRLSRARRIMAHGPRWTARHTIPEQVPPTPGYVPPTEEEFGLLVDRISTLEGQLAGIRPEASKEASDWRFAARDVLRCIATHGIDHKYTDEALWNLADTLDGYDPALGAETGHDYWKARR